MRLEIETQEYDAKRYGVPYIAKMSFYGTKGEPTWGRWEGEPGCAGTLIIEAERGDVIMRSQRDDENIENSIPNFFILSEKNELEQVSKKDAYAHFNNRLTNVRGFGRSHSPARAGKNKTNGEQKMLEFEDVETLELPTYSLKAVKDGDTIIVRALSEISAKPDVDRETGEQKKNKNGALSELHTINVVDSDGVEGSMLLPFVPLRAFSTAATSGALAGRWFKMTKIKSESNKTTSWMVKEVRPLQKDEKKEEKK